MPTDVTVLQRHSSARLAETPILAELHSYWVDKRAERFAPCRSDIDPIEIPSLLPHLLLLDVIEAGARFRYRLAGTEIERRIGCQLTGRHLDEVTEGQYAAYIHGLYRQLLRLGRPLYSESEYGERSEAPLVAKRLMLPLSADGETINMVLCGQIVSYAPSRGPKALFSLQNGLLRSRCCEVVP